MRGVERPKKTHVRPERERPSRETAVLILVLFESTPRSNQGSFNIEEYSLRILNKRENSGVSTCLPTPLL